MQPNRRFTSRRAKPHPGLPDNHAAVISARTAYPTMVRAAVPGERVLKSGEHSRKLGSHFSKRPWMGMPIYSLTLEERRTCPRSCAVWNQCYGNGMNRAVRWEVNKAFYTQVELELEQLSISFPRGFAVRLHTLGDFPDLRYLAFWLDALRRHPALHTFGFTVHARNSPIGATIEVESAKWDRFRIRFSNDAGPRGAMVLKKGAPTLDATTGIICPADSSRPAVSCGSCALCLNTQETIVFPEH